MVRRSSGMAPRQEGREAAASKCRAGGLGQPHSGMEALVDGLIGFRATRDQVGGEKRWMRV